MVQVLLAMVWPKFVFAVVGPLPDCLMLSDPAGAIEYGAIIGWSSFVGTWSSLQMVLRVVIIASIHGLPNGSSSVYYSPAPHAILT